MRWFLGDLRGRPRWAWLLCAALLAAALAWWGWPALAGLPVAALALLRGSRWVQPREPSRPDPARTALDAHVAAYETDRALAAVAAEAAAREAAGAHAAETDDIATVRARVEDRARLGSVPTLPRDPVYEERIDKLLRDRRGKP